MNRREILAGAAATPLAAIAQQAAEWKPLVLDAHQLETVIALEDLLIPATDTPGAKAAGAHRYLDLFLADGPDQQRFQFIEGLAWVDRFAQESFAKTFLEGTAEQRQTVMAAMYGDGPARLKDFGRQFKGMVARIFYNTALGYRELNKGGRVPRSFGCQA
jgi:hypothetical protein